MHPLARFFARLLASERLNSSETFWLDVYLHIIAHQHSTYYVLQPYHVLRTAIITTAVALLLCARVTLDSGSQPRS